MPEKILIVDDDADSLKLIAIMLQKQGYEVLAASSGHQALTRAVNDAPDLIILDIMMPDMNGYEVCRRLRSNPDTQPIPIIMFTAKTLIDDKVAGFEAGADDYLTKPTHPAELSSRVKSMLQRSAHQRNKQTPTGMTIGVVGIKGGVGTTTIALNIAAALKLMGENPIVSDFRLGAGSLGLYLGAGRSTGMVNVLGKSAAEIRPNMVEKELITHHTGLRALLSSTRSREGMFNVPGDSMLALVSSLRHLGKPAVFDLGSGYNPLFSRLQGEMDKLAVLVDPTPITVAMAQEFIRDVAAGREQIHVVVVNRAGQSAPQISWQEIESRLECEIRAVISSAPDLAYEAAEAGTPIVNYQPNAVLSSQLIKLAEDLNLRVKTLAGGDMMS
jgi:pilus assembly protein CpaE